MNRRDFLKVSGLAGAGLAIRPQDDDVFWPEGVLYRAEYARFPGFALTIDDGWHWQDIDWFVKQFDLRGWTATFFMNGSGIQRVRESRELVGAIAERHEVAYHTMYHPSLDDQKENYDTRRWIRDWRLWFFYARQAFGWSSDPEMTNHPVKYYARAAGGYFSEPFMAMCKATELTPVAWSSDPWLIKRGTDTKAGDILLFHIREVDKVWIEYVEELEASGLRPVKLSTLLAWDRMWKSAIWPPRWPWRRR